MPFPDRLLAFCLPNPHIRENRHRELEDTSYVFSEGRRLDPFSPRHVRRFGETGFLDLVGKLLSRDLIREGIEAPWAKTAHSGMEKTFREGATFFYDVQARGLRAREPGRSEHLAIESYPGCEPIAEPIQDFGERDSEGLPHLRPTSGVGQGEKNSKRALRVRSTSRTCRRRSRNCSRDHRPERGHGAGGIHLSGSWYSLRGHPAWWSKKTGPQLACIARHQLHPDPAKSAYLYFCVLRNAPSRPLIHLGILTGRPLRNALLYVSHPASLLHLREHA
jgi:hypothetical protein